MARNLKALGLALVAVLAIGAWGASGAISHTPATFTAPVSSEIVGEETVKGIFKVTNFEMWCKEVSYTGVTPASTVSSETQTITPSYKECEAEGVYFTTVNVTVTGFAVGECDYVLKADEKVDLVCAAGKEVTFEAGICTIHIPAQSNLGSITYTTGLTENRHDLTVHINLSGITTNHTKGFACLLSSGGESATATFAGTTTVSATKPKGVKVDLTWDATVA